MIPICIWSHVKAVKPQQRSVSWDELCDLLTTFTDERPRDSASLWSPTQYRDGTTRSNEGIESLSCLVIDVDCGIVVEDVSPHWDERGLAYIIHSTAHHLREKNGEPAVPRWRAIFPLKTSMSSEQWSDVVYPRLATYLIGTAWDNACKDPARISWLPMIVKDHPHFSSAHDGAWLSLDGVPELPPTPAKKPPPRMFGQPRQGLTPGDDFAARGDHVALLTNHGWKFSGCSRNNELWTRPDKRSGTSATWNVDKRVFYCFTSSTELAPMRGYSLFQLYALLNNRGDFAAAARDLARQGFGAKSTLSTGPSSEQSKVVSEQLEARTVIHVTHNMPSIVDQLEAAVSALRPRRVFQRSGHLVRLLRDADPPRGISREKGSTSIGIAPVAHLTEIASLAADWLKFDKRSDEWVSTIPPIWAIQQLANRGEWRLPVLSGVSESPTLRPDGTVLENPGYDEETGVWLETRDSYPRVKKHPDRADAANAAHSILEVFEDFPVVNAFDRSAILAALLTVVCRDAIAGPVPLFTVDARVAGTGKSLLVDAISIIYCGRKPAVMAQSTEEAEERKRLFAIALEGSSLVLIDNLTLPLGSGALDAALTSGTVSDRVLGQSETKTVPWRAVVFATGNNIQVRGDTGRRVIPINLDAEIEQPEERTGWKHDPLREWVTNHRCRLVTDCLTIIRAFFMAGLPKIDRTAIGSFEAWDEIIRGPIMWLGLPDPAQGRARVRSEADSGLETLRSLLHAWYGIYQETPTSIAGAIRDSQTSSGVALRCALGACDSRWRDGSPLSARAIGWACRRYSGRVVDGMRLVRCTTTRRGDGVLWAVECMDRAGSRSIESGGFGTFGCFSHTSRGNWQSDTSGSSAEKKSQNPQKSQAEIDVVLVPDKTSEYPVGTRSTNPGYTNEPDDEPDDNDDDER